jgi:divalent metal cation (Fe/Co/Zn/Cd) transporter
VHSHPHRDRHRHLGLAPRVSRPVLGPGDDSVVALLADVIHNFGDALTAVPLGIAFILHSTKAERRAGFVVVAAIGLSACVAGVEAVRRLLHPITPDHLVVLAIAGALGFVGNSLAARIRTRAGHRLESPALIADGHHALPTPT